MPVRVECKCGKAFQAPDHLTGKTVRCPSCKEPLPIPAQADHLLDELSNLESAAAAAALSGPNLSGVGGSGAGIHSGLHYQKPKKGVPIAAVISGGIISVICLILILVLILGGTDDDSRRAGRRDADAEPSPVADTNDTDVEPGEPGEADGSDDSEGSDGSDSELATQQPETSELPYQQPEEGQTENVAAEQEPSTEDAGNPEGVAEAAETEEDRLANRWMQAKLRTGVTSWISEGKDLRGTRIAAEDKDGAEVVAVRYSWMVDVLPHVDQQSLYDKFDFEKPWRTEENRKHASEVVPEFLSPGDERKNYEGGFENGLGLTHFVGMSGLEDISQDRNLVAALLPRSDPRAGMFGYGEIATIDQVTDGTSNTIMLIGSGMLAAPWVAGGGSTVRGARRPYFNRLSGFGTLGYDKEGAAVLMVDGSARWIDSGIDENVFRAMCTIGGGETVDLARLSRPNSRDVQAMASSRLASFPRLEGRPLEIAAQRLLAPLRMGDLNLGDRGVNDRILNDRRARQSFSPGRGD